MYLFRFFITLLLIIEMCNFIYWLIIYILSSLLAVRCLFNCFEICYEIFCVIISCNSSKPPDRFLMLLIWNVVDASLFQGILTSETRCLNCENVSSKDEDFFDLQVDIEQNTSITHCLRCFSNTETLCSDNKFKCDNCSSYQEAQKRMRVKKLPMILALHLKRFKYMEQYNRHIKVSHRVVFPLELRLFNTVSVLRLIKFYNCHEF